MGSKKINSTSETGSRMVVARYLGLAKGYKLQVIRSEDLMLNMMTMVDSIVN